MGIKSSYAPIIIAAITAQHSTAFQPAISRRSLLSNIATTSAATTSAAILLGSATSPAIAKEEETKNNKKQALRGGKNMSDALHNGTDLNGREAEVASGLLDKMGLVDISPDKGPSARAPPSPKKR